MAHSGVVAFFSGHHFLGTMAQEPMGLNIAVDRFFKSWLVDSVAFKAAA